MAEQLQTIQRRIKSIESTEKITNAMQLVAAARLKQSTKRFNYSKEHLESMTQLFKDAIHASGADTTAEPDRAKKEDVPSLTVVITGSKGMCGSYNSSIIHEMDRVESETLFLPLGSKGYEHIKAHKLPLLYEPKEAMGNITYEEFYAMPPDDHSYMDIYNLVKDIQDKQRQGVIGEINLIFAAYKNSITYEVVNRLITPVYNTQEKPEIEPIIDEYTALSIYGAISESALNEYGARRLAMKNASDNAEEMLATLEMQYHRARQEDITNELIEIISGTDSQRNLEEEKKKG